MCSPNEKTKIKNGIKKAVISGPRCKKVNNGKNGTFGYEMIGETRTEVKLLVVVAFLYLLFAQGWRMGRDRGL